jgi:ArsR family transcriptional regulator
MTEMNLLLRALADSTRLRLLNLMTGHEVCVCFFEDILKMSQPKISRHLAYLRKAGLAEVRREGRWMHYRITPPNDAQLAQVFNAVIQSLEDDEAMRREREKLVTMSCCPPAKIRPRLRTAPRPAVLPVIRKGRRPAKSSQ